MSHLILASGSVWRKKLLGWLQTPFEVIESGFDEKSISLADPEELVAVLAQKKAEVVARLYPEAIVVGADTVIAIQKSNTSTLPGFREIDKNQNNEIEIIGKPIDIDEAREILEKLRGREHSVFTGLAVIDATTGGKSVEVEETLVTFRDFSDEVMDAYLSTGESLGKAGAYQILTIKDSLVQNIEGGVTNIIGLPLGRLSGMLEEMGIQIDVATEDVVWNEIGFRD